MDMRDLTFISIHNLTHEANIIWASHSVELILGWQPHEVVGKSCFEFFHPDEEPFARSIHTRGVELDKAAVLHYLRVLSKNGEWVDCECCFTIVYDVIVASTSIYMQGGRAEMRANDAPVIRRLFSSSPLDPRYHMLEHLSSKFRMAPVEREPRAALVLNRFTRQSRIMYATDAVSTVLGMTPSELVPLNNGEPLSFYDLIDDECLAQARECLESAKANESIAYMRFTFKDPREVEDEDGAEALDSGHDDGGEASDEAQAAPRSSRSTSRLGGGDLLAVEIKTEESDEDIMGDIPSRADAGLDGPQNAPAQRDRFELEAVISCTSDGLIVVVRRARPMPPPPQPRLISQSSYSQGLFAAPWGERVIEPQIPHELFNSFRAPLVPEHMPLRPDVEAADGPPRDMLMRSIQHQAVFAWGLTGINGKYVQYGRGKPRSGAVPPEGLPVWDPNAGPTHYRGPDNYPSRRWANYRYDDDSQPDRRGRRRSDRRKGKAALRSERAAHARQTAHASGLQPNDDSYTSRSEPYRHRPLWPSSATTSSSGPNPASIDNTQSAGFGSSAAALHAHHASPPDHQTECCGETAPTAPESTGGQQPVAEAPSLPDSTTRALTEESSRHVRSMWD